MNLRARRVVFLTLGLTACSGSVNVPAGPAPQEDIDSYVRGIDKLGESEPAVEEGVPV